MSTPTPTDALTMALCTLGAARHERRDDGAVRVLSEEEWREVRDVVRAALEAMQDVAR